MEREAGERGEMQIQVEPKREMIKKEKQGGR